MTPEPASAPGRRTVRQIMTLAMVCWNLPIMVAEKDTEASRTQALFDHAMKQMPDPLGRVLLRLIEDRKRRFGAIPFYVTVRVAGTTLKDARLIAAARMPSSRTARAPNSSR